MSSAELLTPQTTRAVRRFAIAWRNRQRRVNTPVGVLDRSYVGSAWVLFPLSWRFTRFASWKCSQ
jgi:hypothetical protein